MAARPDLTQKNLSGPTTESRPFTAAGLLDATRSPANQLFDGASPQRTQIGGFPYYLAASGHQSVASVIDDLGAPLILEPDSVALGIGVWLDDWKLFGEISDGNNMYD